MAQYEAVSLHQYLGKMPLKIRKVLGKIIKKNNGDSYVRMAALGYNRPPTDNLTAQAFADFSKKNPIDGTIVTLESMEAGYEDAIGLLKQKKNGN